MPSRDEQGLIQDPAPSFVIPAEAGIDRDTNPVPIEARPCGRADSRLRGNDDLGWEAGAPWPKELSAIDWPTGGGEPWISRCMGLSVRFSLFRDMGGFARPTLIAVGIAIWKFTGFVMYGWQPTGYVIFWLTPLAAPPPSWRIDDNRLGHSRDDLAELDSSRARTGLTSDSHPERQCRTRPVADMRSWPHHALMREASSPCCCASLPDLAAVPMGGDGLDERVFATVENVVDHGGDAWWLHLSQCRACGQHWMIAQEERIFDEHFLRRLSVDEAKRISITAEWPVEFLSYERVLRTGHALRIQPCVFVERLSPSLVWTAEDLRKERPDISVDEIAFLLGVTAMQAESLLASASSKQGSWWQRMRDRLGW